MALALTHEGAWLPWFAWRPVRLMSGRWAWLRRIERRRTHFCVPAIGFVHTLRDYR